MEMKYIIPMAGLLLLFPSCTDEEGAKMALESQGFDKIEMTGYTFFGCDEKDTFHTGFKACRGPENTNCTSGVVCSGLFKGSTIRYN